MHELEDIYSYSLQLTCKCKHRVYWHKDRKTPDQRQPFHPMYNRCWYQVGNTFIICNIHKDKQTQRQTDKHTHRQADKQTDRHEAIHQEEDTIIKLCKRQTKRQTDRQTKINRQADKKTNRQADTAWQTNRQTDRQTVSDTKPANAFSSIEYSVLQDPGRIYFQHLPILIISTPHYNIIYSPVTLTRFISCMLKQLSLAIFDNFSIQ